MIELEPILNALTENQVHFVIIDGVAVTAHGSAYVTQDLDIAISALVKTQIGSSTRSGHFNRSHGVSPKIYPSYSTRARS